MDDDKIYDADDYQNVNFIMEDSENNNGYSGYDSLQNDKKRRKKRSGFGTIALVLIGAIIGGAIGSYGSYYFLKENGTTQNINYTLNPQSFTEVEGGLTASEAFNKVAPAVVVVSVNGVMDYSGIIPQEVSGIGSGFIINEEGYILTNYHVVEGAQEVVVTLSDGKDVAAKVVNYDQNQDVAMLKINDESVKVPGVVELGDSSVLQPGEEVLAIGTPLSKDFNQTVTGGMVSAVNRSVETSAGVKVNLIQTDAAINPGNSGGPLINTKGEVVGINTLKISDSEVEGIGFAIPINEVKDRIESLSKPILKLGVTIREIDETLAKQYDMEEGLYIVSVSEFSSAEKAGIQSGDIIVKFDNQRVKDFEELRKIRDSKSVGDIVSVEVIRNGENKTLNLQLEE
jgi:serine protease Do